MRPESLLPVIPAEAGIQKKYIIISNKMKQVIKFVKEAIRELGKVTWPTRKIVLRLTIGVIIVSIIFTIFVGIVDLGLTGGLRNLLNWVEYKKGNVSQQISDQPMDISLDDIQVESQPSN